MLTYSKMLFEHVITIWGHVKNSEIYITTIIRVMAWKPGIALIYASRFSTEVLK